MKKLFRKMAAVTAAAVAMTFVPWTGLTPDIMNRRKTVPAGYDLNGDSKADIKDVIWLKLKVY